MAATVVVCCETGTLRGCMGGATEEVVQAPRWQYIVQLLNALDIPSHGRSDGTVVIAEQANRDSQTQFRNRVQGYHGSIKAWFLPLRVYEENAVIYGKIKMADFVYWFDFVIVVALCVRTSS